MTPIPPGIVMQTFRILHYYRRKTLLVTLGVMLLALVLSLLKAVLSPTYVATTSMTSLPRISEIEYAWRSTDTPLSSPAAFLSQTHMEFLLSRNVAEEAIDQMEKEAGNEKGFSITRFTEKHISGPFRTQVAARIRALLVYGTLRVPSGRDAAIEDLRSSIGVRQVPGSYVLRLSVRGSDPTTIAKTANVIAGLYLDKTRAENQEGMRLMRVNLERSIAETEAELTVIDQKIMVFKEESEMYLGPAEASSRLQELTIYIQDYNRMKAGMEEMKTRIAKMEPFRTKGSMAGLEAELASLESKMSAQKETIDKKTSLISAFPEQQRILGKLIRDQMDKERALSELRARALTTKAVEASQMSAVRIIDPAVPPSYPTKPNIIVNLLASFFVGLFLSGGVIIGQESSRKYMRTAGDLAELNQPYLGALPYLPKWLFPPADRSRMSRFDRIATRAFTRFVPHGRAEVIVSWHRRVFEKHLDHLCGTVLDLQAGKPVLLVSSEKGAGKSFLAKHLAETAKDAGKKVLIIDANMIGPTLHGVFDLPLNRGLSDLLAETATDSQVIQHVKDGIDFISAGSDWMNSMKNWNADRAAELFKDLAARYDLVLVESAAIMHDSRAARVWRLAGSLVLVFDAETTTHERMSDIHRRLVTFHGPIGCVLNKVKYPADLTLHA